MDCLIARSVTATVSTNGKMLPPFLIFKGKPSGHLAMCEFTTYPNAGNYTFGEKDWMVEEKMYQRIDVVLKLWKEARYAINSSGQPPIIILSVYRMHQMGSVVNYIQLMGIEVVYIPPGCTYLCQPINMGVNIPVKC
jgi:hypothetical protein